MGKTKQGNSEFKIEKDVPMPARRGAYQYRYPFADMEVGDSFEVKDSRDADLVRRAAYQYGKYHGKKFMTRQQGSPGHVRVWRIE